MATAILPSFLEAPRLREENQDLQRNLGVKDMEIQRLNLLLTPFKTVALERYSGTENEALAKLGTRLNDIQTGLEHLSQQQGPRHLSPEVRQRLLECLKDVPKGTVCVVPNQLVGRDEAFSYANEFLSLFSSAGYDCRGNAEVNVAQWPHNGLGIELYDSSIIPPFAASLMRCLVTYGIVINILPQHDPEHFKNIGKDAIILAVGEKP